MKKDKSENYDLEEFMIFTDENKKGYKLTKRGRNACVKIVLTFALLVVIVIIMLYLSKLKYDLYSHLNGFD